MTAIPCAWVNDASGPFLGKGVKYWHFESTTCRQCIQLADRVYLGQIVSKCLQTIQRNSHDPRVNRGLGLRLALGLRLGSTLNNHNVVKGRVYYVSNHRNSPYSPPGGGGYQTIAVNKLATFGQCPALVPWPCCCIVYALRAPSGKLTQDHPPPICWQQSSKAHKITMKLPSNWYSNVPMNKPLSLVRCNYGVACKMHTCSSGKCHTQIYHQDGGHTTGNKAGRNCV